MMRSNIKTLLLSGILLVNFLSYSQWTNITNDILNDGAAPGLLDGTKLDFRYDPIQDSLWFRVTTAAISAAQSADLGVNIMVNYPGGGATFNFWGTDNSNPFHRLVTGWVTGTPPSNYTGTIGIANPVGVGASNFTNVFANNLSIIVNPANSTIVVGMKRLDLIPDAALGQPILTAAAVGASTAWNDDIYSASGMMTINVNNNDPTLKAGFTAKDVVCEEGCITFEDTTFGTPISWNWTVIPINSVINPISNLQNPEFCFLNSATGTTVTVELTVQNIAGSISKATKQVNIVQNPTVVAIEDTIVDLGNPAILSATATGASKYYWNPDYSVVNSRSLNTFAYPEETTSYVIRVDDANGCFGQDTVKVFLNFLPNIGVPTAFSPNGDGRNDLLVVKGIGLEKVIFKVYNRYGAQVFATESQKNGWDGNIRGKQATPGTYYWTLEYEFISGQNGTLNGNTTLVR